MSQGHHESLFDICNRCEKNVLELFTDKCLKA